MAEHTRYLHLATHGLVEPGQQAIYSSLALTQPRDPSAKDTGFLTLLDLFNNWNHRLDDTELVVLSACESQGLGGRGENLYAGEGAFGLPWGFMYAGSPAVIASLWNVNDASTAELMGGLYAGVRRGGVSKLDAFVKVRQDLRGTHPEPYFWAPFVYVGDPR